MNASEFQFHWFQSSPLSAARIGERTLRGQNQFYQGEELSRLYMFELICLEEKSKVLYHFDIIIFFKEDQGSLSTRSRYKSKNPEKKCKDYQPVQSNSLVNL
jgi:hypothetical protein